MMVVIFWLFPAGLFAMLFMLVGAGGCGFSSASILFKALWAYGLRVFALGF